MSKKPLNNNFLRLTGTLINTKGLVDENGALILHTVKNSQSKRAGERFISGSIELLIDEATGHKVTVDLFSYENVRNEANDGYKLEADGSRQINAMFKKYIELPSRVESAPRLTIGEAKLEENRYWSKDKNQIVSYNRVSGRFVNDAYPNVENESFFEFAGYVVEPISERRDQNDQLLYWETTIAQTNWNNTLPVYVKFIILPEREDIANGMADHYVKGTTVEITGHITTTEVVERVSNEGRLAFGDVTEHESTKRFVNYVINGGGFPIEDVEEGAYSQDLIEQLTKQYDSKALEIQEQAKQTVAATAPTKSVFNVGQGQPATSGNTGKLLI